MLRDEFQLAASPQTEINVFCHHALALSIILAHEEYRPWYYERFVQLWCTKAFYHKTSTGLTINRPVSLELVAVRPDLMQHVSANSDWSEVLLTDFIDTANCYDQILEVSSREDIEEGQVVTALLDTLRGNRYVYLTMDEFHIPNMRGFGSTHTMQRVLVFGYAQQAQEFSVIGFDKNQMFTDFRVGYAYLIAGYSSALSQVREIEEHPSSLLEMVNLRNPEIPPPFRIQPFMEALQSYQSSICTKLDFSRAIENWLVCSESLWEGNELFKHVAFGRGCELSIEAEIVALAHGRRTVDYRHVHLLYEHKMGMLRRLNFVARAFSLSAKIAPLLTEYKVVVGAYNSARLNYLRFFISHNPSFLNTVVEQLSAARLREADNLFSIHQILLQELSC